jgi:hypothetical protein
MLPLTRGSTMKLLLQDRGHRAGHALDVGVDEVQRHRLAA